MDRASRNAGATTSSFLLDRNTYHTVCISHTRAREIKYWRE